MHETSQTTKIDMDVRAFVGSLYYMHTCSWGTQFHIKWLNWNSLCLHWCELSRSTFHQHRYHPNSSLWPPCITQMFFEIKKGHPCLRSWTQETYRERVAETRCDWWALSFIQWDSNPGWNNEWNERKKTSKD